MKTRVGVLISGRGSNMEALIRAASDPAYPAEIALVIANRPDAAGLPIAREAGAETLIIDHRPFGQNRRAHEEAIDAALRARHVEVVCLAGYMRLLTPWLVQRWAGRMLNIHPSLLPDLPGLDTHARALSSGHERHGCTVHIVTETMDEGPILAQRIVAILPGDDADALAAHVLAQEHLLYPAALAAFLDSRRGSPPLAPATPVALQPTVKDIVRTDLEQREMAEVPQSASAAPSTAEGFLADRLSFWTSVTKFMTRVVIGLVVLMILLWWFLV